MKGEPGADRKSYETSPTRTSFGYRFIVVKKTVEKRDHYHLKTTNREVKKLAISASYLLTYPL
jgi:hypothetical protein